MRILLFLLLIQSAMAGDNKFRFWLGTFGSGQLTDSTTFNIETQVRYGQDTRNRSGFVSRVNQILYRTGFITQFTENSRIGALYGYIQSTNLKEHRYTFQHQLNYGVFNGYSLSHRIRVEGRFLENQREDSIRYRYLLRFQNDGGLGVGSNFTFFLLNEIFINSNKRSWNGDKRFERNRLFIGFTRKLKDVRIEIGYLNQLVPRKTRNTIEHIAVFNFFI